jgi:DNA-binding PadR family transcriptional regulator
MRAREVAAMLKFALLALLARSPRHGYELKSAFEALLGGTWPLNIGQIYTTLTKLEQDGLVECTVVPQAHVPDRKVYAVTKLGRKELARWIDEPVPAPIRLRDEAFLKVLLHHVARTGSAQSLIWRQREDHIDALAQVTQLRGERGDDVTGLLLDGIALRLEADLKWLDLVERRLTGPSHDG